MSLNRSGRNKIAEVARLEGSFLEDRLPIRAFVTLTFTRQPSHLKIQDFFHRWIQGVQKHNRLTLGWIMAVEPSPFRHLHIFLVAARALDCLQAALAELRPQPEQIARIDIATYRFASVMKNPDPLNYFASKYSLPHAAAIMAVRGHAGFTALDDTALNDPTIAALRHRVQVGEDPAMSALAPRLRPARVTVTLTDGRQLVREVEFPRGHAENPMTDAEVEHKFRTLVVPRYGKERADRVLAAPGDGAQRGPGVAGPASCREINWYASQESLAVLGGGGLGEQMPPMTGIRKWRAIAMMAPTMARSLGSLPRSRTKLLSILIESTRTWRASVSIQPRNASSSANPPSSVS